MGNTVTGEHEPIGGSAQGSPGGGEGQNGGSTSASSNPAEQPERKAPGIEGIKIVGEKPNSLVPRVNNRGGKGNKRQTQAETKKESATADAAQMIGVLLKTVSDIAGMRPGMEHWRLSPQECAAIAAPTASIMERYDLTKNMGKYGDFIALGTALSAALVPRVMYQIQMKPKEVQNLVPMAAKGESANTGTTKPDAGKSRANGGSDNGRAPDYGESATKQLLTSITG